MPDLFASTQPSMFSSLESDEINYIHTIWDKLVEFPVQEIDAAAEYLMASLCELANAQNANWVGAVCMASEDKDMDPYKGWRAARTKILHPDPNLSDRAKKISRVWDRREPEPSLQFASIGLEKFRVYSYRRDLPPDWFESPFYETFWKAFEIYDAVYVGFPVNQEVGSHFGFHRIATQAPFSELEIARLAYALRGIKWFHRQLMLSHGLLLASSPLSPSERRVLSLLSTDRSEKEIAFEMGLSASTLHHYVKTIFRKFGVRSRAGLMSLWLNNPG